MKRLCSLLTLSLIVVVLSACAPIMYVGSQTWFEQTAYGKESLKKRASFDLSCPADQLQFAPLHADKRAQYTSTGVSGCGKKAVYILVKAKWVLNTDATKLR